MARLIALVVGALVVIFFATVIIKPFSLVPSTTPTSTVDGSTSAGGPDPGILPYQSGVQGVVMLGPTCPVQRVPPDPACADKPYQTLVAVFRTSDTTHALALFKSAPDGTFKASLPPGDYLVTAGESNLPRCAQQTVTVAPSGYANLTIMCDTGIR